MHNFPILCPGDGGQLYSLGTRRGGVHGLQENLHGDFQVLGQVVGLIVIRFQYALSCLVILACKYMYV